MIEQNHSYEIKDKIAILKISGPIDNKDKLLHLSRQLNIFYEDVISNHEIRVIVLVDTNEKAFDIQDVLHGGDSNLDHTAFLRRTSLTVPISSMEQPVIAAMTGNAMGQGLELLLACDIRMAAETSRFGLPQIKNDFIPFDGGTQRLSRLIGRGKALELILTGKTIDAQEAMRIGLMTKILPKRDIVQKAMETAKEMAAKSPISLRYAKEAIQKGMDLTLEQGLRLEADLYMLIHTTKDRTEGIRAFQEKREALFKGE